MKNICSMVEHLSTRRTNVLVNLHWLQWVLLDLDLRLAEVWTKYKSCGLGPRKQPRESLLLSDSHLTNFNWITWPLFMVSHLSCGTLIHASQPWLQKKPHATLFKVCTVLWRWKGPCFVTNRASTQRCGLFLLRKFLPFSSVWRTYLSEEKSTVYI